MPAYHHGSEIEVLKRAGVTLRFYGREGFFPPSERELAGLPTSRCRGLYLIHYVGLPQDSPR